MNPRIRAIVRKEFTEYRRNKTIIITMAVIPVTFLGLALGIAEVVLRIMGNAVSVGTVVLVALLLIFGSQFTLFAMWFDMESNKDLR